MNVLRKKGFIMNKDLLKFFFIAILSFPTLGKSNSGNSKYIKRLPPGKIREYCEKAPEKADSHFLAHVIWSADKEKSYPSMTKAEQLAYKSINRFLLNERTTDKHVIYSWKDKDYKFLTTVVREITLRIKLSVEQTHKEVAKVLDMCIKLEKEAKKVKKETTKKRS